MVNRIRAWFNRNKVEKPKKTPWDEDIIEEEKKPDPNSFGNYAKGGFRNIGKRFSRPPKKPSRRRSIFMSIKRIIAGGLSIIFFFTFLTNPSLDFVSITFFINAYLLVDYIWNTRILKWIVEDAPDESTS